MTEAKPVVFVIDDEQSVRDGLQGLIRSVGLQVSMFGSTQEFLESERPDVPGCLVLDIRLPGMGGLDFQRELAKSKINLPIVFITGHDPGTLSVSRTPRPARRSAASHGGALIGSERLGGRRRCRARSPFSERTRVLSGAQITSRRWAAHGSQAPQVSFRSRADIPITGYGG
ncbi:MAG: response regulator [Hyphomicrobiaceae bacterium]